MKGLLPHVSHQTDYRLRYFWVALAYTNVVVNPVGIFFQIKSLRVRLRKKLGFVNQVVPANTQFVHLNRESSLQTMGQSGYATVTIPGNETVV